jgi:hypothetical protein
MDFVIYIDDNDLLVSMYLFIAYSMEISLVQLLEDICQIKDYKM